MMRQGGDGEVFGACLAGWCVRKTFLHLEDEAPAAASRASSEPPRRLDLQALEAEQGRAQAAEVALREALAVQWPGWCWGAVGPEVKQHAMRLQP